MTVIAEIGPQLVRRLDGGYADPAAAAAALTGGDDALTLLGTDAVTVAAAWRAALSPLLSGEHDAVLLYPSRWPARRVRAVTAVAAELTGAPVRPVPRRQMHTGSASFVEIDPDAVLVGDRCRQRLVYRAGAPQQVAEAVVAELRRTSVQSGAVAVDAPAGVPGGGHLAALIATALHGAGYHAETLTDARIRAAVTAGAPPAGPVTGTRHRHRRLAAAAIAAATGLAMTVAATAHRHPAPDADEAPAAGTLIEGRLAVAVPVGWTVRRITAGPGSARIEVSSPQDPQLALQLTQARSGTDRATTTETLRRAVASAPPGIFVDFDADARRYGRPGIGYRELRPGREIAWTVLTEDDLRIGIGCQSPPGAAALIAQACETAIRTAQPVG